MDNLMKATLTLSEDKKTLFITSMSGYSQQAYETGSIFIDLQELDHETFSMKYVQLSTIFDTNKIITTGDFDLSEEEAKYNEIKNEFAAVAHICFDTVLEGDNKCIESGTVQQRYSYYFLKVNPSFENNLNINLKLATSPTPHINGNEISPKEWIEKIRDAEEKESADFILTTQPRFVDSYWFQSLADVIYFELINVIKGNIVIKRCECCNRYFVPSGRNDSMYCNRIAPGSQKTCIEIGAIRKYEKETENNPIKKAYRTEYKKRYARVLKGKVDNSIFFEWSEIMKSARDEALKGKLAYEEFMEMLKK